MTSNSAANICYVYAIRGEETCCTAAKDKTANDVCVRVCVSSRVARDKSTMTHLTTNEHDMCAAADDDDDVVCVQTDIDMPTTRNNMFVDVCAREQCFARRRSASGSERVR